MSSLLYTSYSAESAHLIIGGTLGQIVILDIGTGKLTFKEEVDLESETVALFFRKNTSGSVQMISYNAD